MTTIRVARRKRYTSIDRRALNDARLSFRARGVLAWLLDKPDDWRSNADTIAKAGREGRDAIRAALTELQECGYLKRNPHRKAGKWATEWTVYELPNSVEPGRISSDGKPATENPHWLADAENQALSTEDGEPNTDLQIEASQESEPAPCERCNDSGWLIGDSESKTSSRCVCNPEPQLRVAR